MWRDHKETNIKFVADVMFGKLTRWLRLLGYNVKYYKGFNDDELFLIGRKEKRILITRDLELYRQALKNGVQVFYPTSKSKEGRLAELAKRFNIKLDIDENLTKCSKCNTKLIIINKKKVKDKVNKNTLNYYNKFWQCSECKQIYWQGAHWKNIRSQINKAKKILAIKK
jgi:uncharacterized protein with PIN domain